MIEESKKVEYDYKKYYLKAEVTGIKQKHETLGNIWITLAKPKIVYNFEGKWTETFQSGEVDVGSQWFVFADIKELKETTIPLYIKSAEMYYGLFIREGSVKIMEVHKIRTEKEIE